jgi:homoserine/homoserine lactone efflux protein
MPLELYAAFVAAVVVLILIPGPNVALIVANSVAYGVRFGLVTVAGTATAMVLQLGLTVVGMTTFLAASAQLFGYLRWIGVAYLLYLGWRSWNAPAADLSQVAATPKSALRLYLRGFLVSLTNPKTLLFYGAFLPQFVSPDADPAPQLGVLAVTFVVIALVLDGAWAVLAGRLRRYLAVRGVLRNRLTGGLLAGAGAGLALAHRS